MPWREYPGQDNIAIPPDYQEKTEWAFARLMYPPYPGFGRGSDAFEEAIGETADSSWTTDYTAADRHVAVALRRLTRIHVRSVEQPVNLDDGDDVFNYPWLYAVEVGHWQLTDSQVKQMRDFLDARRILHVRRFSRHPGMGRVHGDHAARVSRTGRSWISR